MNKPSPSEPKARAWVIAANSETIPPGTVIGIHLEGTDIALCRLDDGSFHAVSNLCSHEQARLSDGWLIGSVLCCPFHGGQFDVKDGRGVCEPAELPIARFAVRLQGGHVEVSIPRGSRQP